MTALRLAMPLITALPLQAVAQGQALEPCMAVEASPDAYVTNLRAAGWQDLPAAERDDALARLADAFLPLAHPDASFADLLDEQPAMRASFINQGGEVTVFDNRNDLMLFSAGVTADNRIEVQCIFASRGSLMVDAIFVAAPDVANDDGRRTARYSQDYGDGQTLTLQANRYTGDRWSDAGLMARDGVYVTNTFDAP